MRGRTASLFCSLALAACQVPRAPEPVRMRSSVVERALGLIDSPAPSDVRTAAGAPGPQYWQQRVDYVLDARLDADARSIAGTARLTYTNHSPHALEYLWLGLDQNVFRESSIGARVRGIGGGQHHTDGMELLSVKVAGAALDVAVYDTLARVDLPAPIASRGGTVELEIEFRFQLVEQVVLRHGVEDVDAGTIFQVAQWFPCAAVYDDVHGWNTLPYVGGGEFYTNVGDFDVRLTVPRDHLVVATGELQNPAEVYTPLQLERLVRARGSEETVWIREPGEVGDPASRPAGDGPLTWHFRAERVRTFAFASSPAFVLDAAAQDGVLCQSAYPAEALPLWGQSTQMVRRAVNALGRAFAPYPFPVATSVSGAEDGMEYPMIVFCGEREDEELLWEVTAHEIAHSWFPMLVNTDERRHAWMDEGLVTFMVEYVRSAWRDDADIGLGHPPNFAPFMQQQAPLPILIRPDTLPPWIVGMLQYGKTATALVLLREDVLGPERFDHAFRTYIDRWAWKSPRPADFFRCIEDAAGADLGWFWRGWFAGTGVLDQAVTEVVQAHKGVPARVTFENVGQIVMPLTYRAKFSDGTQLVEQLPPEVWAFSRTVRHDVGGGRRVRSVEVDPDGRLPDVDLRNNRWGRDD